MARKKIYKTNKGKVIDMEAMRTANEQATATGNMGVNAKGDQIKGGKVVKNPKQAVAIALSSAGKSIAKLYISPRVMRSTMTDLISFTVTL